ncbi:MAG: GNAT family N-acetyltransferase [Deltaproteobacteria bacterium]|nr:GNAT family N-acetyltransferase [Deltaproteobacteria bacterium]
MAVREEAELGPGRLDTDDVLVRTMSEKDLEAIVRIDAVAMGRRRLEFYRDKIAGALRDSRVRMSLVAELDAMVVGFLMAQQHYGEFGRPEPTAVLEAIGVHPDWRSHKVGKALMRQFAMNARGLGVERIRTEVAWNDFGLLGFLEHEGFTPGARVVLERVL